MKIWTHASFSAALLLFWSGVSPAADGPVKFTAQRLTVDANEGIDIADVDKDGLPDIISGRNWFKAPEYIPHPLRSIEDWNGYVVSNGDFAYDVNKDGWMDVISGSFLQTEICWYENPKEEGLRLGQLWKRHVLVDSQLSQNEGNLFVDLDGDDQPEFLVDSWNKTNPLCAWKLGVETRTETFKPAPNAKKEETREVQAPVLTRWTLGERANGHGMAVGDISGDGKMDILVGQGWYEQPAADADKAEWTYHADWMDWHAAVPCLIRDLNGDGQNDIIWAKGHDYGIFWWEITGRDEKGSLQWTEHEIDRSFSQAHALHFADVDGDGQDELITGKRVRAHNGGDPGGSEPAVVYYYDWDAKAQKFVRHDIDTSGKVGIGLQIRTADLNGDGLVDIALAGKSGTHVLINLGK
ncbi:MAG: VCBS repeat-containing protein [Planctomycetaceae bacterium]|nr:VCBS repeat-containing protein [Planctomycetaceae bacterium]